jgi:hypothetical protein
VATVREDELVSFGLATGCVQVQRADQPILLMADHKTGLLRAAGCVMPNLIRVTFARWRGDYAGPHVELALPPAARVLHWAVHSWSS